MATKRKRATHSKTTTKRKSAHSSAAKKHGKSHARKRTAAKSR